MYAENISCDQETRFTRAEDLRGLHGTEKHFV